MVSTLTVPASLEKVVLDYDEREEPFDKYSVGRELNSARDALVDATDSENCGAWAEVLAFALETGAHNQNPWNSYFGPMGSGTDAAGNTVYFPEIAGTAAVTVEHWQARARSLNHPFLKARYADLAWEMSGPIGQRKRDPEDARIAIDSYITAIPRMAEDHDHVNRPGFAGGSNS
jgi:lysyl-tRNA synthetase class 1